MTKQRCLMLLKAEKRFIKITYFPALEVTSHISNSTIFSHFLVIKTNNLTLAEFNLNIAKLRINKIKYFILN